MVYAHKGRHMAALFLGDFMFRHLLRRRRPIRMRGPGNRTQGTVEFCNQPIQRGHQEGTKLNQPVMMYLCCVGDTTPTCVWVKSEGQIKVRPLRASNVWFWYTKRVPPPSVTSLR